jgi:hypothetical protein
MRQAAAALDDLGVVVPAAAGDEDAAGRPFVEFYERWLSVPSAAAPANVAAFAAVLPGWVGQLGVADEPFRWVKGLRVEDVATFDAEDALAAWAAGSASAEPHGLDVAAAAGERFAHLEPEIASLFRQRAAELPSNAHLATMVGAAWDVTAHAATQPVASSDLALAWSIAREAADLGSEHAERVCESLRTAVATRHPAVVARYDRAVAGGIAPNAGVANVMAQLRPPPERAAPKPIVEADLRATLHEGRLLAWHLASAREPVVVRAPIGAGYEARVEQAPFADDEFEWTIRAVGTGGGEPMAQGWSQSLEEAIGATEAAMVEGSQARAMTPEESAAHLAARPEFAARVDRTVRRLAEERGLLPAEGGQEPAGGVVSSAKLGPVGRAFPDAGAASPVRPAGPSPAAAPGGDAPARMRGR